MGRVHGASICLRIFCFLFFFSSLVGFKENLSYYWTYVLIISMCHKTTWKFGFLPPDNPQVVVWIASCRGQMRIPFMTKPPIQSTSQGEADSFHFAGDGPCFGYASSHLAMAPVKGYLEDQFPGTIWSDATATWETGVRTPGLFASASRLHHGLGAHRAVHSFSDLGTETVSLDAGPFLGPRYRKRKFRWSAPGPSRFQPKNRGKRPQA